MMSDSLSILLAFAVTRPASRLISSILDSSVIASAICSCAVSIDSVSNRITTGRLRATLVVNNELIATCWAIGRDILDRQAHEGYGTKVIDRLSADLKVRFPAAKGYSSRNLKYMRAFAEAWPDPEVVQRSVAQLPWRHQIALLEKLKTADQRLW